MFLQSIIISHIAIVSFPAMFSARVILFSAREKAKKNV